MAEDNPVRIKEEAVDIEIPHSPGPHGNIEEPEMVDASNPICVKEEPEDTSLSVLLENHGNSEEFITDDYPAMDASNSIHIKEEPQDHLFILPGDYGNGEEFVTDDCNGSRTTTGNSICMPCKTPDASSYVLPGNYEDAEELVTGHGDIGSTTMPKLLSEEEVQQLLFPDESEANSEASEGSDFEPEHEEDSASTEEELSDPQNSGAASLQWKKKAFTVPATSTAFRGNSALPREILMLETPYQYFRYFFTDDLVTYIAEQSSLYSAQIDPGKPTHVSPTDVKKFLGICIYMSLVHMPSVRDYWDIELGNKEIASVFSVNTFEKIKRFLHFCNNEEMDPCGETRDRLYKIRPVFEELRSRFLSVPMEECLSLDEQICSTKARCSLKPHKWGHKLFVLSGVSGYAYDLEVYTGQENCPTRRRPAEPDLGAAGNIVVRLSREIPRNVNHKLYFGNYYTSPKVMVYLAKQGILSLGTVRRDRVQNCKLPTEKQLKSAERGTTVESIARIDGVDVAAVVWKDNKTVMLLSTFVGVAPKGKVSRYDQKAKTKVEVECPNIILQYNLHMGGVYLLDGLMGRYKITMRSQKWYLKLFYHLIDLTMVNAWLLYKRSKGGSTTMPLVSFRKEVAQCLSKQGATVVRRGRPSGELQRELEAKKKKGPAAYVPPQDVRLDQLSHWPQWMESRQRCKRPQCPAQTFVKCEKCAVALCLNKSKNCFYAFHNQ